MPTCPVGPHDLTLLGVVETPRPAPRAASLITLNGGVALERRALNPRHVGPRDVSLSSGRVARP